MKQEIDLIKPQIFPENKVLAGVTKRNFRLFQTTELSLSHIEIEVSQFKKNLKAFSNFLGISESNFRYTHQIHSDRVIVADETEAGEQADALITNKKNMVIFVKIADCAGILIFEPEAKCIAAIHSGWKGTKQNIVGKTIQKMQKKYNANPTLMLVYISPMASASNYEVGSEFLNFFPSDVIYNFDNKLFYDNKKMIIKQLLSSGVKKENIESSDRCTIEELDLHSYRRDKDKSGRMAAFICLK